MGRTRRVVAVIGATAVIALGLTALWAVVGDRSSEPPGDLSAFEPIDLGELAGAEVTLGLSRARVLPGVVPGGPGATRLVLFDVEGSRVTDAGPIPIDEQITDLFPTASDQFVTMVVSVCPAGLIEEDTGMVCELEAFGPEAATQLVVYDLAAQTWAALPIDSPPGSSYDLIDTDGAVATFHQPGGPDGPERWATVALDEPLELGPFSTTKPDLRPNGFAERFGHMDGFGWKTQSVEDGRATTWTGTLDGKPKVVVIDEVGDRSVRGAGNCVLIATRDGSRVDHAHRLCAT